MASAIVGQDNGQALRARSLLVSLYTAGGVLADVSGLMTLDWPLRRDLCTVLLAFGHGEFGYDYIRSAFEQAGDLDARWFFAAAPEARERLRDALRFAKAGSMGEPRSSGERRVADLLVSLFTGASVNLQQALQGLDADRANMVAAIVWDYLNGRFDFTDDEIVRAHFILRDERSD